MSYVIRIRNMIGKKVRLTEKKEAIAGYFEIGTVVKITECDQTVPSRGYTFEDEHGNKVIEAGWTGFEEIQSGSRGFFSPSPHTTQASGSALGGSQRVLEYDQNSDCIPGLATTNTPIIIAPPDGFIAFSSMTGSSLLSKVRPFTMSQALPRAFG